MEFLQNNKMCVGIIAVATILIVVMLVLYLTKTDEYCEYKDKKCSLRVKEGLAKCDCGVNNPYAARPQQVAEGGFATNTATIYGDLPGSIKNSSGFRSGFSGREAPVFWVQGDINATRGSRSKAGYKILTDRYQAVGRMPDGTTGPLTRSKVGPDGKIATDSSGNKIMVPVMVQKVQTPDGSIIERTVEDEAVMTPELLEEYQRYLKERYNKKDGMTVEYEGMTVEYEGMSDDAKLMAASNGFRSY